MTYSREEKTPNVDSLCTTFKVHSFIDHLSKSYLFAIKKNEAGKYPIKY